MSEIITLVVKANGGTAKDITTGKYLSVKTCTLPILAAFNSGVTETVQAGRVVDKSTKGFSYVVFTNPNAQDVTISFFVGQHPATYQPADNSVANARHFALGNLGIASGAGAAGGLPACSGTGYLAITDAMNLSVPGTNNGHRRQLISFDVATASAAPLNVLDANGFVLMVIPAGQARQYVTDADLRLSGAGGVASAAIGQIFLNS